MAAQLCNRVVGKWSYKPPVGLTLEQSLKSLQGYRINYGLLMNWQLELVPAYILQKHTPFP
eukprot:10119573-Prorocentrum_lima.AAC.1